MVPMRSDEAQKRRWQRIGRNEEGTEKGLKTIEDGAMGLKKKEAEEEVDSSQPLPWQAHSSCLLELLGRRHKCMALTHHS